MRIAVIGTGISGLISAHLLAERHDVTVYEAGPVAGGHAHTVTVDLEGTQTPLDTGFLVYNERTYPDLVRFFARLGVVTEPSDMSFSVSDQVTGLEYRGTSFNTLFAQRANLTRRRFWRLLFDVRRFNRTGRQLLDQPTSPDFTLADLMGDGTWSKEFIDWYLVPLGSSIWSADPQTFLDMPAHTLAKFFDRHGMLSQGDKPRWRTVSGGSTNYVEAALAPVRQRGELHLNSPVGQILRTDDGVQLRRDGSTAEYFDQIVVATHSDQALELLADASVAEKEVLGAIKYQPNQVTLHTDQRMMPGNRRAWASWNYRRPARPSGCVTMTYHLNRLQGLGDAPPVFVTLNREAEIDDNKIIESFCYSHPVIDAAAVRAQRRRHEINGRGGVWFCGAYWRNGFHEDGIRSGLDVCQALGAAW